MKTKCILALAALALTASVSAQTTVYITFGDGTAPTDTSVTWNTVTSATTGTFSLLDQDGNATAFSFGSITGNDPGEATNSVANAAHITSALSWFDNTDAGQSNGLRVRDGTPVTATLSGSTIQSVDVEWVAYRSGNSRAADFTINGSAIDANFLNSSGGITSTVASSGIATGIDDTAFYLSANGIAPVSNNLVFSAANDGGSFAAFGNAMRLEIVAIPEPSTFALFAGALGLGLVMLRRRRA